MVNKLDLQRQQIRPEGNFQSRTVTVYLISSPMMYFWKNLFSSTLTEPRMGKGIKKNSFLGPPIIGWTFQKREEERSEN